MALESGAMAVVGVGDTEFGALPGKTSLELHAEAARSALNDAGLRFEDIDGIITAGSRVDGFLMHSATFAEYVGLQPRMAATLSLGGANHCAAVQHAAAAIHSGMATNVLIVSADNLLTGRGRQTSVESLTETGAGHPDYENPFGPSIPGMYALVAARHMYEYGTQLEDLAEVAVAMRTYASHTVRAHYRTPITIDDVLNSKPVALPLRLLDCCPISDGGGAFIVSQTRSRTQSHSRAVPILGVGGAVSGEHVSSASTLTATAAAESGRRALVMAALTPMEMDVAMLYDSFTIAVLIQLEDLGFCPKGEAGPFVRSGALRANGKLPTNTHGGLLSHGHPGRPGGIAHIVEAVRQLRGEAGPNQVPNAHLALIHGSGGILSTHATLVLGT